MSRDSGSKDPSQRTVAELLAEHGGGAQRGSRRRRRRAEDPSETAPQAIIERVNSDSGRMLPVEDADDEVPESSDQGASGQAPAEPATGETHAEPAPEASRRSVSGSSAAPPQGPPAAAQPGSSGAMGVRFSPEQSGPAQRVRGREAPVVRPRDSGQAGAAPAEGASPEGNDRRPPAEENRGATTQGTDRTTTQQGADQGNWAAPQQQEGQLPPAERDTRAGEAPEGRPTTGHEPDGSAVDTEVTAQQPPLPAAEPGGGALPAGSAAPSGAASGAETAGGAAGAGGESPRQPEAAASVVHEQSTERFPPVSTPPAAPAVASAPSADPEMTDGDGTTLLEYPEIPEEQPARDSSGVEAAPDPYEDAYYAAEEPDEDPFADAADLYGEVDGASHREELGGADDSEYADEDDLDESAERSLPAGLENEDADIDSESADPEDVGRSRAMDWVVLAGQTLGGLLAGGLVWIGFRWLWRELPLPALAAALAFTGALVLGARKVLRTDDLQTILLSVLVGLACTVSPVALLLVGH
ncbi:hypothetical protein FHR84_002037 [Actinopolyspora biskrensis]|uniref:Uncharacterized protein n=1 Tax=Actinopolyspora biskrensis TaxID=1470178 RepID=A0A852YYB1_9ACTN|nr:hypothetical protein [Actinopolyspora biskrensis]NYH78712.1 hypothetical protein [Actinopolyspora biskrensis]